MHKVIKDIMGFALLVAATGAFFALHAYMIAM